MLYFLRPSKSTKKEEKTPERTDLSHSAYHDKIYLWFIALTILFASCFFQIFNNLNAYYRNELHFSPQFIGLLGAINGLIITFIEMVFVFKMEGKRSSTFYIARGILLCGLAFLMLNLFHIDHALAICMMLLITIGEIFALPFMNTFWTSRSSAHNRGQYAGLYTIGWSVAQTAGPFLGSQVAQFFGFGMLWWIIAGGCFAAAAGFVIMQKKLD